MKIVVTGGAGFVGSHLCDRLVGEGHEVTCVDGLVTGRRTNVEHLLGSPNFVLIEHDIIDPMFLPADRIYNLASQASPRHYQANAIRTIKTNTIGVINVLGLAKRTNARFLQASTSEVYGDPLEHPQTEDYRGNTNPFGPRACYDEGKRLAEALCFEYHAKHAVDTRLARIFNTYGPRMAEDDGRVISNFCTQALKGEPLTIYGEGQQTRSFCYVDDLVEGLVRLMEHPQRPETPINLGNPVENTILQIADLVSELTGSSPRHSRLPMPIDDPSRRCPDIKRARKLFGWEPKVPLREGLSRTIAAFRGSSTATRRPT
jgi:UDP-glucuronate decarboxylase